MAYVCTRTYIHMNIQTQRQAHTHMYIDTMYIDTMYKQTHTDTSIQTRVHTNTHIQKYIPVNQLYQSIKGMLI